MSFMDDREIEARADAANPNATRRCARGHAIVGRNVYRDSLNRCQCYICRIERGRQRHRRVPSQRKPRTPIDPAVVEELRRAAGIKSGGST